MIDNRNYRYQWLDTYGGVVDNQIITPYFMAEKMVNEIPLAILRNPKSKYLDVATKSGVYLVALYNKLMTLLADVIPDRGMRAFHIMHEQLYGLTESMESKILASEMLFERGYVFRNIVYIERYSDRIVDNNNLIKEAIERKFGADMKFDVILGNPPYQSGTGGGGITEASMPLYNYFIQGAMEMEPSIISMIIPSRWMSGGKSVLDDFRRSMVECGHIKSIHNYEKASEIFEGPDIAGGVQHFVYSKDYTGPVEFHNCRKNQKESVVLLRNIGRYKYTDSNGKEQYMIIADNKSAMIVEAVRKVKAIEMDTTVLQCGPFGLRSDFQDRPEKTAEKQIKVVCSKARETWTSMSNITQNKNVVDKWKVCVGKVMSGGLLNGLDEHPILSQPFILKPGEVCSITYLVLDVFENEQNALNMLSYIKTKFARFLISITLAGMNMTSRNFMFVIVQDYSKPWTDGELYEKYNLTQEQIEYIEKRIRAMD